MRLFTKGNVIPSLAVAAFGVGGLITGLIIPGLFFEAYKNAGLLNQHKFVIESTVLTCLSLGSPFVVVLGILLFFTVFVSLRFDTLGWFGDYVFPSLSLVEVFIAWIAKDYLISGQFGWTGFVHAGAISALCAFSHGIYLHHRKLRGSLKSMLSLPPIRKRDLDIMIKRLELEHNSIQTTLQLCVWAVIIFLTAGVAGYYYSPFGNPEEAIIGTRLLIVFIGMSWAMVGFVFGIAIPMVKTMEYLTIKMAELI